jgi:hypothetical protein
VIDVEKDLQELSRLEAHVAWVQQNLGDGPSLDRHLAEISKIRGAIAAAAQTKCQLR